MQVIVIIIRGENYFLKKRILIVDDESDITLSLKLGLEQYEFKVNTYNDTVSALSEFKAGFYAINCRY